MITEEKIDNFFLNDLGWKNWKNVLKEDRLKFLHHFQSYYRHNNYFHNIALSKRPASERRVPDEDLIISEGFEESGGSCVTLNGFCSILLSAIGFNSYLIAATTFKGTTTPDNHVICIVEFSPEEKYLLDIVCVLKGPIPLHNLPFTVNAAGISYQYVRAEEKEDSFERFQLDGKVNKDYDFKRQEFTLTPRKMSYFNSSLKTTFTDYEKSWLLRAPFIFRYFEEDADGNLIDEPKLEGDCKWIYIRGVSVTIGSDNETSMEHFENYDELKPVIKKYFPRLKEKDVLKAFDIFNEAGKKYGIFSMKPR